MVTLLITSLVILAFLGAVAYFWQKPASTVEPVLLPQPELRGLFTDSTLNGKPPAQDDSEAVADRSYQRADLLERAAKGDKSVLEETPKIGIREQPALYEEVLNSLVEWADSGPKLLTLVSHVTRHELPVNKQLAAKFIDSYKNAPDKSSTAKMLHIAALSNDAAVYQAAVVTALESWRKQLLPDVSPQQLLAILEGEFWILSSHARSSGAGFILKRTLAIARRDLEAAHND